MLKFDDSICHSSHHVVEVWSCEMKWQESHSTYYSWTVTTSPASTNSYAVHTKVSVCLSVCLCVCVCVCVCLSESPCMVSPYLKCIAAFIRVNLDLCTWERGWGVIVWVNELVSEWVSEWVSVWVIEWVGEWAIEWVSDWMSEWLMSEWMWVGFTLTVSVPPLLTTPHQQHCSHPHTYSLTHPLTHSPTHSLPYLLTYLPIPMFSPSLTHTLPRSISSSTRAL